MACFNADDDPEKNCASKEEILKAADSVAISWYFRQFFFDSDNFESPKPKSVINYEY